MAPKRYLSTCNISSVIPPIKQPHSVPTTQKNTSGVTCQLHSAWCSLPDGSARKKNTTPPKQSTETRKKRASGRNTLGWRWRRRGSGPVEPDCSKGRATPPAGPAPHGCLTPRFIPTDVGVESDRCWSGKGSRPFLSLKHELLLLGGRALWGGVPESLAVSNYIG